jgi:anti-sigma regulatory factor (Ser/Thr protein kinase)
MGGGVTPQQLRRLAEEVNQGSRPLQDLADYLATSGLIAQWPFLWNALAAEHRLTFRAQLAARGIDVAAVPTDASQSVSESRTADDTLLAMAAIWPPGGEQEEKPQEQAVSPAPTPAASDEATTPPAADAAGESGPTQPRPSESGTTSLTTLARGRTFDVAELLAHHIPIHVMRDSRLTENMYLSFEVLEDLADAAVDEATKALLATPSRRPQRSVDAIRVVLLKGVYRVKERDQAVFRLVVLDAQGVDVVAVADLDRRADERGLFYQSFSVDVDAPYQDQALMQRGIALLLLRGQISRWRSNTHRQAPATAMYERMRRDPRFEVVRSQGPHGEYDEISVRTAVPGSGGTGSSTTEARLSPQDVGAPGAAATDPRWHSLNDTVIRVVNHWMDDATHRKITIRLLQPSEEIVTWDETAGLASGHPIAGVADMTYVLEAAIAELLTNAIKYSPTEGGEIIVSLRREGETAVIQIQDGGIGIAPEDLPRVLETPGFRTPAAQAHTPEGGGEGLSGVQELLRQYYGGSLAIESRGAGQGTTVTVRIPLRTPIGTTPAPQRNSASGTAEQTGDQSE